MSFATDTLTLAQTAYQNALSGKTKQLNGRRLEQQEIDKLLEQMEYWEARVAAEDAKASGTSTSKPMQVVV